MELKTPDVAARLGVSPKTIQRWVRKYNIPLPKNEAGHYLFDEKTIALLERVKFEQGAALETQPKAEPKTPPAPSRPSTSPPNVPIHALFQEYVGPEISRVSLRLDQLEQQLEQKADDVVSVQLLHHRREMEEITARLTALEQLVARLEQQLNHQPPAPHNPSEEPKRKRRGLGRVMNLFV
ncbi:MerR family transcriptional regulator [Geobacillus sp. Manikaran-105]|uniref:MerR family transcriptional regulator n=1 Tax=Geobacillus sp. Manikaran-105 TaxID=2055940 RepID=UPI000C28F93F|nr:MerR family transcriptional regulator [Geobacillus sp. Manikaran-105]PJW14465.1 MerR family transcriptional regulator [Geobacillus sp. Manikaran-105]